MNNINNDGDGYKTLSWNVWKKFYEWKIKIMMVKLQVNSIKFFELEYVVVGGKIYNEKI